MDLAETGPVNAIEQLFTMRESTLLLVAVGVLAYGALELTEAVGLWLMRRWGEYVAVVGTALFIPLEVHELLVKVTWLRVAALVVNLFAVVYLLWTKRLFGLRGGHAAFLAERRNSRCWRSSRPQRRPSTPGTRTVLSDQVRQSRASGATSGRLRAGSVPRSQPRPATLDVNDVRVQVWGVVAEGEVVHLGVLDDLLDGSSDDYDVAPVGTDFHI